jgi:hypothetical protein
MPKDTKEWSILYTEIRVNPIPPPPPTTLFLSFIGEKYYCHSLLHEKKIKNKIRVRTKTSPGEDSSPIYIRDDTIAQVQK